MTAPCLGVLWELPPRPRVPAPAPWPLPLLPLLLLLAPPPRPLAAFLLPLSLMLVECSGVWANVGRLLLRALSLDRSRLVCCLVAVPCCVNARWNPETNETKMALRC
jgi:hypothetical protein